MIEIILATWLHVADRWEPYHLNQMQKDWFSTIRPKNAFPACCDTADGFPADDWAKTEEGGATHYRVLLGKKWWDVPDRAVVNDMGNPVGVPVVWFTTAMDSIRCFVPGPES